MKDKKTLITYYMITLLLSFISLLSFNNKGNDFLTATASITADLTLIITVILITYTIIYSCNYYKEKISKKKNNIKKSLIISLSILLLTIFVVFISFVNIYSHKNIFEYIINCINKKENLDIIKLFIESLFIYLFIFLCSASGIIVSNKYEENDNILKTFLSIIVVTLIISIVLILFRVKLLYFMIIIDIILYISIILLWNKINSKKKNNH